MRRTSKAAPRFGRAASAALFAAGVVLFGSAPAWAVEDHSTTEPTASSSMSDHSDPMGMEPTPSGQEGTGAAETEGDGHSGDQSHISECVIEAVEAGTEAEECVKAPNPIVPATNELVWGSISFVVLFVVLWKFGVPAVKKGMDARAARISGDLDEASRSRDEASAILDQYQRQLADAKSEASRIIEAARQDADRIRADLHRQAETEVSEIRQRASDDIAAQAERVKAGLRAEMAQLSIELAEKVVERSLDRDTNMALIESFINQAGRPSAN